MKIGALKHITLNQMIEFVLIVFICFSLFDFNGTGQYFGYFVTFIVLFFRNSKISNLKYYLWIILFGISYSVINYLNFGFTNGIGEYIRILILPVSFFFAGSIIAKNKSDSYIIGVIVIFIIFYSSRALFSIVFDIINNGFFGFGRGVEVFGYSNSESILNATNLFSLISLNISLISFLFLTFSSTFEIRIKYFFVFIFFISLFSSIRIGSRTAFAIIFISLFMSIILNYKYYLAKEKFLILVFIIAIISVILFLGKNSLFDLNLFEFYLDRIDSDDFSASSAGGRTQLWSYYSKSIFQYPFGNIPPDSNNYGSEFAHNLWLDVAKKTGAVPFVILIFLFVNSFTLLYRTLKQLKYSKFLVNLFLSINISFLSVFFVEPVLEGMYFHFVFYILVFGIISMYLTNIQNNKIYSL